MKTKNDLGLLAIALTEVAIGGITLIALFTSLTLNTNTKPLNVVLFVLLTSLISTGLGLGILKHKKIAYNLLKFFATYIILSKILIFYNIITLNGALETNIPQPLKNITSVVYHGIILWYFNTKSIRRIITKG